ncbi:hypothetical protein PPROV_000510100 [Pycnococcus provasolii]|uniref:Uncharacterized protein n=1 Tax=Pycnococcus provasolii TaxID=41880 RepID=A0A830HHQ5_9CHLO|nr:hypothetical protein PPROV_000510100 [Pycnococcus provasolii]
MSFAASALRTTQQRAQAVCARVVPKRAYGAPADGPPPVDYPWMAPSEPSRWKSEHVRINFFFLVRDTSPTHSLNISQTQQQVVFTVLAGWAVGLSAAKAAFGGGKKEEKK